MLVDETAVADRLKGTVGTRAGLEREMFDANAWLDIK